MMIVMSTRSQSDAGLLLESWYTSRLGLNGTVEEWSGTVKVLTRELKMAGEMRPDAADKRRVALWWRLSGCLCEVER